MNLIKLKQLFIINLQNRMSFKHFKDTLFIDLSKMEWVDFLLL
jgi:hypothetical protein